MKIGDIELGVMAYIQNELAPKATGLQKFLLYTGSALGAGQLEKAIDDNKTILKRLGIMSDDENIDIDKLYNAAKQGIQKAGSFTYMGITFYESDIDKLYSFMTNR